ncbi:MAG: GNAT family N-acetyltransferase [Hyphomicrobiaceae bacterium]
MDDLNAILHLIEEGRSDLQQDTPDRTDRAAFERTLQDIISDSRSELFVAESVGSVIGTFQLIYLPHILDGRAERAQIEALLVARDKRGRGIEYMMMDFALTCARVRGCRMIQLNANNSSTDAHLFYEASGFVPSHEGYKAELDKLGAASECGERK